jgi:hypothetical protein
MTNEQLWRGSLSDRRTVPLGCEATQKPSDVRSPMAEALLRHSDPADFLAFSAGLEVRHRENPPRAPGAVSQRILKTFEHRLPSSVTTIMMRVQAVMKTDKVDSNEASALIDERIRELADWRGETLSRVRKIIHQAAPEVIEEWKWRGVPVWSHAGILCTGETYRQVVKMTFAKGASLDDPSKLFNASLEGNTRRAIDIHEGEAIDEKALKALIQAAVELNTSRSKK